MLFLASVILISKSTMQSLKLHTMSKEPQRPPRYPLQKKNIDSKLDHDSPASCMSIVRQTRHCKPLSESFIDEEKPPWFDDLLSEQDSDTCSGLILRSTYLDLLNELGNSTSSESDERLETSCTYGPNSPKRRSQLTFPITSAVLNLGSQGPLQNLDGSLHGSETSINDEFNNETMPTKRLHPEQRRGAWKLHYIAELERTVSILQTFESELTIKVSEMYQQRSTLQMENSKLKHEMIRLQQEKLIADGQYQSLRKEAERLKARLRSQSYISKISTLNGLSSAAKLVGSEASWAHGRC